jgi:hypothetical protein
LGVFAVYALLSTNAVLASHNPADYTLRVHIFHHNSVSHYYDRSLETVDGEGRANLFENGEPRAFDFRYHCDNRLMNSVGYETYLARWKKPGKEMEILLPAMGGVCDFKVDVKASVVYVKHKGVVSEELASRYKEWMVKHQYDPEHGKDIPVAAAPERETPAEGGANSPR